MKVALTVWQERISPLFDATRMLLIATVDHRKIAERRLEPFDCGSDFSRVSRLGGLGVDVLICGGISRFFINFIQARSIRILPFCAGRVEKVLEAYMEGTLFSDRFRMPGCGRDREVLGERDG